MKNILHLKAPGNWINDPNGFIYYGGKYHLFYQHFPNAPVWGTMHWGHAVSPDLIHWEHMGVALYPTKSYDRNGVFSGSAIAADGEMRLYYTAVRYGQEEDDNIHAAVDGRSIQTQAMISSPDGYTFDNAGGKRQILTASDEENVGDPGDCRDPKVWRESGKYYMCLASTYQKKEGVLLLYVSEDGEHWTFLNRLQDRNLGYCLECPDIFSLGEDRILICSPMGNMAGTEYPESQSTMQKIDFDPETGTTALQGNAKFFDYGMDIYAPQSNTDAEGRRTVIAWVRMPEAQPGSDNEANPTRPWNGMMALPRAVEMRNGEIYTPVHPAVRQYFADGAEVVRCGGCQSYEKEGRSRILVQLSEGEQLEAENVRISLRDGKIILNRSRRLPKAAALHAESSTPYIGESCALEIYLEKNLIEIFVNDGQYVISNVLYGPAV